MTINKCGDNLFLGGLQKQFSSQWLMSSYYRLHQPFLQIQGGVVMKRGAFLGKQPLELVAMYMSGLHTVASFILEFPQNSQVHATSYN